MARLSDLLVRRQRDLWRDPARTTRTLESFAETEADGARDIATAEARCLEPWLQSHLRRHAADEHRHAELFRERARRLRAEHGLAAPVERDPAHDLTRGRTSADVDAHGFFVAGLMDELGEVGYVAMLHVAEKRAARLFRRLRDATRGDPATCAIFEEILKDEQYHVAYTGKALEHWRSRGRDAEVDRALTVARGERLLGAWKRLGARSAGSFGRFVLWIAYYTVLVPFGLAARASVARAGFETPLARDPAGRMRSQY